MEEPEGSAHLCETAQDCTPLAPLSSPLLPSARGPVAHRLRPPSSSFCFPALERQAVDPMDDSSDIITRDGPHLLHLEAPSRTEQPVRGAIYWIGSHPAETYALNLYVTDGSEHPQRPGVVGGVGLTPRPPSS
ncbi:uncharacterized protein AB9W97_005093 [Spinachia spinachia]